MHPKFDSVPVEADTEVKLRKVIQVGDFEALYEIWFWDGITAESLIFLTEDVAGMDEEALTSFVRANAKVSADSSVTIARRDEFTWTNFNFAY
jgi:hypothetical protein